MSTNTKYHYDDHHFFAKFIKWVGTNGGTVTDNLYTRRKPDELTRGIIISPPCTPKSHVVCLHGTGNDLSYPFLEIYQRLFNQGCQIYACDLDGHGRRSTSLFRVTDLDSVVAWAIDTFGLSAKPIHIIGHSLGGTLALAHACRNASRIQSLILISAPLVLHASLSSLAGEALSIVRKSIYQAIKIYGPWGLIPALGAFKRRQYPIRLQANDPSYVDQVEHVITGISKRITGLTASCPSLLIYGTGDAIVPVTNQSNVLRHTPSATLLKIRGATHFSTILEDGVAQSIADFITNQPTKV